MRAMDEIGVFYGHNFETFVGKYSSPGGDTSYGLGFNASRYDAIYGSSNTVTPLSQKTNFVIRY